MTKLIKQTNLLQQQTIEWELHNDKNECSAAEGDWQQNQLLVSGSYIDKYERTTYSMWL